MQTAAMHRSAANGLQKQESVGRFATRFATSRWLVPYPQRPVPASAGRFRHPCLDIGVAEIVAGRCRDGRAAPHQIRITARPSHHAGRLPAALRRGQLTCSTDTIRCCRRRGSFATLAWLRLRNWRYGERAFIGRQTSGGGCRGKWQYRRGSAYCRANSSLNRRLLYFII